MDFNRNIWYLRSHKTEPLIIIAYTYVVSIDSMRLALLALELNVLDVLVADIGNAYLNYDCCEKFWFLAGKYFR